MGFGDNLLWDYQKDYWKLPLHKSSFSLNKKLALDCGPMNTLEMNFKFVEGKSFNIFSSKSGIKDFVIKVNLEVNEFF